MTARDFCYWLQGYLEITDARNTNIGGQTVQQALGALEVGCIQKHLSLVFKHEIDPTFANQDELNKIHGGPKPPGNTVEMC